MKNHKISKLIILHISEDIKKMRKGRPNWVKELCHIDLKRKLYKIFYKAHPTGRLLAFFSSVYFINASENINLNFKR